jgi:hypothetical protein
MRLKKLAQLLVLIALALPLVTAIPDSVVTGPYKISFDIGISNKDYFAVANDPVIDETLGGDKRSTNSITIIKNGTDTNSFATISIISIEKAIPGIVNSAVLEDILRQSADDPRVSQFNVASRTIDGMSGAVASMNIKADSEMVLSGYSAMYLAAFDPTHLVVTVNSLIPWNEGTLQLLKTIHVELV